MKRNINVDRRNQRSCPRAPLFAIVFIGLVLGMTACTSMFSGSSSAEFPFDLMMQVPDLPSGWFYDGSEFPDEAGADTRLRDFRASKDPQLRYLLTSHELSVYPDEQAAKHAYTRWETRWFPTSTWKTPRDAHFAAKDPNDRFRFACISASVNSVPVLTCGYLQRHKRLVSLVLTNIDGKAITLTQFEEALRRVDERMQSY